MRYVHAGGRAEELADANRRELWSMAGIIRVRDPSVERNEPPRYRVRVRRVKILVFYCKKKKKKKHYSPASFSAWSRASLSQIRFWKYHRRIERHYLCIEKIRATTRKKERDIQYSLCRHKDAESKTEIHAEWDCSISTINLKLWHKIFLREIKSSELTSPLSFYV